jgi:hypothetical protein
LGPLFDSRLPNSIDVVSVEAHSEIDPKRVEDLPEPLVVASIEGLGSLEVGVAERLPVPREQGLG